MDKKYKLPIIKEYKNILNEIKNENKSVAIFGFGLLGKFLVELLNDLGIDVEFFCDNNEKKHGEVFNGIEVRSPQALGNKDIPVIIGVYDYMKEIKEQLEGKGCIQKILPYYCCFQGQVISRKSYWENDWSIQDSLWFERKEEFENKKDAITIECLDIALTEKCTLKCKDCANLIQYYKKPKHEEKNKMTIAISRFLSSIDLIGRISILGGEPLTNSNTGEYVKEIIKFENVINILTVTNGTLLPDENLMQSLAKDDRCLLSISDYGIISRKKDEIVKMADENNFKVVVSRRENIWREAGVIKYKELSTEELEVKLRKCKQNRFYTIKDGKLYKCPFMANAEALRAIPKSEIEAVDLTNTEISIIELKEKISEFMNIETFKACQYCIENGKDNAIIPAAIQIESPREYKEYA